MGTVRTEHIQIHQHAVYFFFRHDSGTDYFFRQLVQYSRHTVLHIHRRHIRVCTDLEINRGQRHTVIGTHRRHISHARHTVDGPLQRSSHRLGHYVSTRSGIARSNSNRRRNNVRKLGNGQRNNSQGSETNNDHGDNGRKNRPANK